MILHDEAQALISERINVETQIDEDGSVQLTGKWQLWEIEALAIAMRDHLGTNAEGADEHQCKEAPTTIPSLAGLQSIARKTVVLCAERTAETIRDDVHQIDNPGSKMVFGTETKDGAGQFDNDAFADAALDSLPVIMSEMNQNLKHLGCNALTTLLVAAFILAQMWNLDLQGALTLAMERAKLKIVLIA